MYSAGSDVGRVIFLTLSSFFILAFSSCSAASADSAAASAIDRSSTGGVASGIYLTSIYPDIAYYRYTGTLLDQIIVGHFHQEVAFAFPDLDKYFPSFDDAIFSIKVPALG